MSVWKNIKHIVKHKKEYSRTAKNLLIFSILLWSGVVNAKEVNLGNVQNLQEVKRICARVAGDIDGNVYNVNIPTKLYESNKNKIMNNFPDNEGCTYIVTTKWENGYVVKYTSAFWDTNVPIKVPNIKRDKEKKAEQAKKEAEQEWYYWWMLDIFNSTILDNVWKNRNKVIKWLKEINDKLREWRLHGHKKLNIVKWLGLVKLAYSNDPEVLNLVISIAKKLRIEKDVKSFKL